jgi:spoIIIJ-associated protein
MNTQRANLEVIAPTIEEAIKNGLADLGLTEDDVEIEVLDEGSRGLFGLGSRLARVRLTVKSASEEISETPPALKPAVRVPRSKPSEGKSSIKPAGSMPVGAPTTTTVPLSGVENMDLEIAKETAEELLAKMQVKARVTAQFGEADEERGRIPILIDIRGNDLGMLIGRRAETLNALQYITSLILGKKLGHPITLVVDVEGFRERRQTQIRQLARRMAEQAVKTGRRQILEPMPASERRIIHMELRNYPNVRTESIGEDPHRKVTIIPTEGS